MPTPSTTGVLVAVPVVTAPPRPGMASPRATSAEHCVVSDESHGERTAGTTRSHPAERDPDEKNGAARAAYPTFPERSLILCR